MNIAPFALERYFSRHEFTARYLLSCSDCEALTMPELLARADGGTQELWRNLKLAYTETAGHPLLREAIAEIYDDIDAGDIVVAAPEELIFLLMHALLEPGHHVITTAPAYQSLHEVARSIGCEVSMWEPDEDRGWSFDLARLEALLRPDTRLLVINFPHNPTGHVPAHDEFDALIELARARDLYVLSDEMYRFLEHTPAATLPSACELYARAFSLSGLSKSFGLPGLRIGWLASRQTETLGKVLELKDYTTICNSAPGEILAITAVRDRDDIFAGHRARLQTNLAVLDRFFADYADCFRWHRPAGGSICFPRLLIDAEASAFCDALVERAGIMLVPSSLFQFGERHVRIGYGRDDLSTVIGRFAAYLDEHYR